jgi:hypothetical protein
MQSAPVLIAGTARRRHGISINFPQLGTSSGVTDDEARALKLAMNQSAFRTANERLRRAADSHRFREEDRAPFVCECADENCREVVMLSLQDYEHVRAHPTWFLLVAGHEDSDAALERIVDAEHGYAVVEKVGAAGAEAARLHPRQSPRGARHG